MYNAHLVKHKSRPFSTRQEINESWIQAQLNHEKEEEHGSFEESNVMR